MGTGTRAPKMTLVKFTDSGSFLVQMKDPGAWIKRLVFHVTDKSVRAAMAEDHDTGRIPRAWLTFGEVSGHGWGFVPP